MSHQTPYINPSLFSKPPPNFNKNSSSEWNNFKVPTSPLANNNSKRSNPPNNTSRTRTETSRNYPTNLQTTSRNYPTNSQSTSRNYVTHSSSPTQTRNYSNLQNPQNHSQSRQSGLQNVQSHQSGSQNVQSRHSGPQTQSDLRNYTVIQLQLAARNYQTTPPPNIVRNYQNEQPPNYKVQSKIVSPERHYKDLVFNPIGLTAAQEFKPNVPPPKLQKSPQSSQYEMNLKTNSAALKAQMIPATTLEEAKANYYRHMLYRFRQADDYSNSLLSYSPAPLQPPPPPPPNYPSPKQPPLPPDAPPQKPPPPPPALPSQSRSSPAESMMSENKYYNHQASLSRPPSFPGPSSSAGPSSSPMSKQNYQMQNEHSMGSYRSKIPPPQFYGYNSHFNKPMHYNLKRKHEGNIDQKRTTKKRKKPLSQVVPLKISWTMEEAKKALDVEKECNTRSRRQGLILKFPDQELNRDIVTNFHTSIESVHFQQPSTPRYCFVTLMDSADPQTVIRHINQIPFGLGFVTAEQKTDKQDDQNVRPCDIDPLTLYVGNLAPGITKDDMMKTYPKQKRIDIGYAKKMKYTRYAFVSFHTVDDSIEAFRTTHLAQLHSKSLIVRFRRLHGTVGMPGDNRIQVSPRAKAGNGTTDPLSTNSWDIDVSHWDNEDVQTPEARALYEDDDEEEEETKMQPGDFQTRLGTVDLDAPHTYVPRNVTVKEEINIEDEEINGYQDSDYGYCESDDHYSNVSNPPTPETPGLPDHFDETDAQPINKREEIKEEDYYTRSSPVQFRVLQDTIDVRHSNANNSNVSQHPIISIESPTSEPSGLPNHYDDTEQSNTQVLTKQEQIKEEDYFPHSGPVQFRVLQDTINVRPISANNSNVSSSDADNSTDDFVSVKQEDDEIELSAQKIGAQRGVFRNVENQNIVPSSSIVPAPIVIKKEEENENDTHTHIDTEAGNGDSNNSPYLSVNSSISSHDLCENRAASNDLPDINRSVNESSDTEPVGGLEKSSERCDGDTEKFDWDVGGTYPIGDIKTELEFDDPAGDDNSSDEELDIHDILKKQKKGTKEKGD